MSRDRTASALAGLFFALAIPGAAQAAHEAGPDTSLCLASFAGDLLPDEDYLAATYDTVLDTMASAADDGQETTLDASAPGAFCRVLREAGPDLAAAALVEASAGLFVPSEVCPIQGSDPTVTRWPARVQAVQSGLAAALAAWVGGVLAGVPPSCTPRETSDIAGIVVTTWYQHAFVAVTDPACTEVSLGQSVGPPNQPDMSVTANGCGLPETTTCELCKPFLRACGIERPGPPGGGVSLPPRTISRRERWNSLWCGVIEPSTDDGGASPPALDLAVDPPVLTGFSRPGKAVWCADLRREVQVRSVVSDTSQDLAPR